MPTPSEDFTRAQMQIICERLLAEGWIKEYFFHDEGNYGIKWTDKGLERSAWVNQIGEELRLGPQGLCALLVLCGLHGEK
jgi:hypothetical protein